MSTSRTVHSTILSAALLLGLGGAATLSGCAHETKMSITDLPPAVRATLDRETAGGKVTEVEKETRNGKTVYSADATLSGKKYDIDISEDGTLLTKRPE